jgi:hypothetical protein
VDAAVALAEVVGVKAGAAGRAEKIWEGLSQWP